MSLEIQHSDHGTDVRVFSMAGRLDATQATTAYEQITGELEGRSKVVLDLEGVDYMSSGGLSIIIRLVHHLRDKGGDLYLASPQPFVQKVFDIVSFNAILKVFDQVDEAQTAFD
jgi:anti-sigma B factor antagonist